MKFLSVATNSSVDKFNGWHHWWPTSWTRVGTQKFWPFQQMVLSKEIIGNKCHCWQASMMTNAIDDICRWNLLSVAITYKFHRWQTSLMANVINKSWHWKVLSISKNGIDKKDYWWQMLLMISINEDKCQLMIYAIGTFCQLQQLTNSIDDKHRWWQISSMRVGSEKFCQFQ